MSGPGIPVIVKLGGALISPKGGQALAYDTLARAAGELAAHDGPLVVVHGLGGVGRMWLPLYRDGRIPMAGAALARRLQRVIADLHGEVVDVLGAAGLAVRGLDAPSLLVGSDDGPAGPAAEVARRTIACGLVPVLHGGTVSDASGGFSILSSDAVVGLLAAELDAELVVWATDVDGVIVTTPTGGLEVARRLREADRERTWRNSADEWDCTGGMAAKLEVAFALARDGVRSVVVNGARPGQLSEALAGGSPGTVVLPPREARPPHLRTSRRAEPFGAPVQWASMRSARAAEARGAGGIVHLEAGDYRGHEYDVAPHVRDAMTRAVCDGDVRYDPGAGLPALREAIAEEVSRRGRPTSPAEVVVTAGAKQALSLATLALVEPGDEVLLTAPVYPPARRWAEFAGATVRELPLAPPEWELTAERLADALTPRTRLLVICSPQRPSGHPIGDLERIASVCRDHPRLTVVSDEIFSSVVFDGRSHRSIAAIDGMAERTVLVDSFSKTFAMTGWRIGFAVAPPVVAQKLSYLLQDSITNVATFVQLGALAALTGPREWVQRRVRTLQDRRDTLVDSLQDLPGVTCPRPPATFYALLDARALGQPSAALAHRLLDRYGVAVVAGSAFGDSAEGHLRVTFAVSEQELEEGVARLRRAFAAAADEHVALSYVASPATQAPQRNPEEKTDVRS